MAFRKELLQSVMGIPAASADQERWAIIQNDKMETAGQDEIVAMAKTEKMADDFIALLEGKTYSIADSDGPVVIFEFYGEGKTAREMAERAWSDVKESVGPIATVIMPGGNRTEVDLEIEEEEDTTQEDREDALRHNAIDPATGKLID